MKKVIANAVSWLLAHPVVASFLDCLVHALEGACISYFGAVLDPSHAIHFTVAGFALFMWRTVQTVTLAHKDLILAFLQDQLQALGSAGSNSPSAVVGNVPVPTSSALTSVTKTSLFLLGFFILASMSDAQTILRYQNFSLNKEVVSGPIQGDFLTPMILGGYTPLSIQNNIVTLNSNFTVDAAYAFSHATLSPDGNGGVALSPYWYAGAFVGGGIFSNGNANFGHGTVGLFVGKPDLLGPFALAAQDDLTNGNWSAGFVVVGSLDFLSGTGVVQVH